MKIYNFVIEVYEWLDPAIGRRRSCGRGIVNMNFYHFPGGYNAAFFWTPHLGRSTAVLQGSNLLIFLYFNISSIEQKRGREGGEERRERGRGRGKEGGNYTKEQTKNNFAS